MVHAPTRTVKSDATPVFTPTTWTRVTYEGMSNTALPIPAVLHGALVRSVKFSGAVPSMWLLAVAES
jgi:hypothetical protein